MVRVNSRAILHPCVADSPLYARRGSRERFQAAPPPEGLRATYNAAPSQALPVIRMTIHSVSRWRYGVSSPLGGQEADDATANQRACRDVDRKALLPGSAGATPLPVLADSFYEWKREESIARHIVSSSTPRNVRVCRIWIEFLAHRVSYSPISRSLPRRPTPWSARFTTVCRSSEEGRRIALARPGCLRYCCLAFAPKLSGARIKAVRSIPQG